jgi:hypothetical protein
MHANFHIIGNNPDQLIISDVGPWDRHLTITNDAEYVVEQVAHLLHGRSLFYIDSEGTMDQLLVKDGKFAGFAPGPRNG